MKTIFDLCEPRRDVAEGRMRDEEFAADLAGVVNGKAPPEYADSVIFFRHTHPTRGLRTLLETSCKRLSGTGGEMNSVVRLDTQFGGGKTHSLIALVHAVRGMKGVSNPAEFIDPKLLPKGEVRVAALDGENSDPANGLRLEGNLLARSLWGEMAYRLGGREGFERIRNSDEKHVAPGTDTIVELFGGKPTLILIDEMAIYLRKVAKVFPDAVDQFAAFIQALVKAVAATPRVCLVFTLAVRADDKAAKDAYKAEQQMAMSAFEEAESVVGRKATQLNPTEEDETVAVLQRRLFERVDLNAADGVVAEYVALWDRNKETLHTDAFNTEAREQFRRGYPLHPETLHTLIEKTSSLSLFQRTRGMLRLLARTVHQLWKERPGDAFAIHPHHLDPACSPSVTKSRRGLVRANTRRRSRPTWRPFPVRNPESPSNSTRTITPASRR
jgi:predicted AAA+ superfamily ATPase